VAMALLVGPGSPKLLVVGGVCLFNFVSVSAWNALDCISAETFPTAQRASAMAVLAAVGRLGSTVAQFVNGWLMAAGAPAPLLLCCALMVRGTPPAATDRCWFVGCSSSNDQRRRSVGGRGTDGHGVCAGLAVCMLYSAHRVCCTHHTTHRGLPLTPRHGSAQVARDQRRSPGGYSHPADAGRPAADGRPFGREERRSTPPVIGAPLPPGVLIIHEVPSPLSSAADTTPRR
jgi:hypothetical protein